jgi:hypothetical protein
MSTAIFLCDLSGVMAEPWAEAGYDCLCIDTQHSIRRDKVVGRVTYRWGDVRQLTPSDLPKPSIIFAFTPCTNLAVSGARDFQRKGMRGLIDGLEVAESCRILCEWYGCPWMLENPVSTLSTYWRKPDHIFTHWNYGDLNRKKTCLWTGGGFVMPPFNYVTEPPGVESKTWKMPPGDERANLRSETPPGFARAVFEANHTILCP